MTTVIYKCFNSTCHNLISKKKYCSPKCVYSCSIRNKKLSEKIKNIKKSKLIISNCKKCDKEIIDKFNRKFCSNSCSATYNNTGRRLTNTWRKNIQKGVFDYIDNHPTLSRQPIRDYKPKSKSNLKKIKTPASKYLKVYFIRCSACHKLITMRSIRKTCSKACNKIHQSKRQSAYLKYNRKHIIGRAGPSYMEKSFKEWLVSLNVQYGINGYLTEIHFINRNTKKQGWIDFLFPRLKLCVELDGNQHEKRKEYDKIRDQYLIDKGYRVLRIKHYVYKAKTMIPELLILLNPLIKRS